MVDYELSATINDRTPDTPKARKMPQNRPILSLFVPQLLVCSQVRAVPACSLKVARTAKLIGHSLCYFHSGETASASAIFLNYMPSKRVRGTFVTAGHV